MRLARGVVENKKVEEKTIILKKGDNLLFYTDGLTEAFSPAGDYFEEERVIKALTAGQSKSAQQNLQGIEEELEKFVGDAEQSDDLTILLLKRE